MLHDPSHRPQPIVAEAIRLQPREKEVLRRLVAELAQIAQGPVHREKAEFWRRLNDLGSVRPMVWIDEIPWHEMDVDGELTLQTQHPWAREWETTLRQTLYQWRHLPADMIVSDFIECPLAIYSTDFGIVEDVDVVKTDEANPIVSRHYHIQIREEKDLEKIQMPKVTHVTEATESRFHAMSEELRTVLGQARDCHVELIMKDISTVRYQPQRLWEWATLAMEEAERAAK
ncbi:MAG: hypothetical protein FJ387_27885 [Verrucomicrobia bacterium]|nr:hypothetical protein [Verrucomicrobiota bacterium]